MQCKEIQYAQKNIDKRTGRMGKETFLSRSPMLRSLASQPLPERQNNGYAQERP